MVNVNCTGGGGYFSDDVSATKAQVVKGKRTVTKDQSDEVVEGTMAEIGESDSQKSNAVANSNLYLRMTNGAHRTNNQTSGYPEVYIPLQTLRSTIGATDASKILTGTTIAGLAGTMVNRGAWSGALTLSGQITIPQGWHNGSGKITRSYSTYAGGTFTPSSVDQTIPTSGKILTGNVNCKADANLIDQNIANGVSIFGVTGNMMKYTSGTDQVLFSNGTWSNQMRYGMTPVCWCYSSSSVSGSNHSNDTSSYLAESSTRADGYHIDGYATYSASNTLLCTTKDWSWQGNDDDEYGFGVVYLRMNNTFNPQLYSGVNIVRDFNGHGSTSRGQVMYMILYDTSGNRVSGLQTTLYSQAAYTQWSISDNSYTFTFPDEVYKYSQLRMVLKFENNGNTCYFTSAIKSIKLISK